MAWSQRTKRGPWWMPFLAVGLGLLVIRMIAGLGGGNPPPAGSWSAHDGSRLILREDGSASWTEAGSTMTATTTWEAPLLRVHLPDGRTVTFVEDGPDLSRSGGESPPYRRDPG